MTSDNLTVRDLEFDGHLDSDGEMEVCNVEEGGTVWLSKSDAVAIVAHLQAVFGL